ncbi:MAG: NifB/NifX family molybdenum-iron cluster-binding protein [Ruminiclostridium sp.]
MNENSSSADAAIEKKTLNHPCYNCGASNNARIHLPVAPKCNIQCNYCVRKFDCINESRPGVVSKILSPKEAAARYDEVKKTVPKLTVAGIAGPGDALANFDEVKETLTLIRQSDPDVTFCLSTNGLMLPFYANHLISLGVSHVTVTVNTVNAETGAKIYDHVTYLGKMYKGVEGAAILIQNQLSGIRYLASMGIVVKVNIVLLKGINEAEIKAIISEVKDCGCKISNIMQLIPVKESAFEYMGIVSNVDLNRIRKECQSILPQMYHCKQCRADAIGTLDNDISFKFSQCGAKADEDKVTPSKGRYRFAVCSKDGVLINEHFGHATQFYIYDYIGGKAVFVEERAVEKYCNGPEQHEEDEKIVQMVKTIGDCDCVVCMRIGNHPSSILNEKEISVYTTYNRIEDGLREAAAKVTSDQTVNAASKCS